MLPTCGTPASHSHTCSCWVGRAQGRLMSTLRLMDHWLSTPKGNSTSTWIMLLLRSVLSCNILFCVSCCTSFLLNLCCMFTTHSLYSMLLCALKEALSFRVSKVFSCFYAFYHCKSITLFVHSCLESYQSRKAVTVMKVTFLKIS